MWFNFVEMSKFLIFLSREISSLQSTMKGKGDEEMQHIQVLTFFNFTHRPDLRLAGASHHERPVDPRVEADVVEGLRSPLVGCDRDAIL